MITTPLSRRSLSLSALAVVSGGLLAACGKDDTTASPSPSVTPSATSTASGSPSASGSATPTAAASAKMLTNLDGITVAGKAGVKPVVTGPWPAQIAKTTSKVLTAGPADGLVVEKGGTVEVHYLGLNARDGKTFDESFTAKQPATFSLSQVVPGFEKGLVGKKVGDRVVIMMPSADGYADGNADIGILKGDNLVFVVDIQSTSVSKATGTPLTPKAGLPTVTDNGTKAPTVSIGSATKPSETVVQTLIKGPGAAVKATDAVLIKYTCVAWDTGKVLAENFTTGAESGALAALIPAWKKGLVGQTVGSRVLVIAAPADAYPKGNATPSIPAGQTLVYVIDLLFAGTASS